MNFNLIRLGKLIHLLMSSKQIQNGLNWHLFNHWMRNCSIRFYFLHKIRLERRVDQTLKSITLSAYHIAAFLDTLPPCASFCATLFIYLFIYFLHANSRPYKEDALTAKLVLSEVGQAFLKIKLVHFSFSLKMPVSYLHHFWGLFESSV